MWKKKIMWWIILSSLLTHGLLAITFSCMVTNFMVCFSYLNGTLTLCRRVGHLIKYPLVPGRFECSTQ